MRRSFLALAASVALPFALPVVAFAAAHVNTNAGGKLYVCATPQNADLSQAQFEALAWVQVSKLGSHGETGKKTNILSYNTWDTAVIQKAKGLTDAGSPVIEVARDPLDAGQIILRTIAAPAQNDNFAFKLIKNDAVSGGTPTTIYNRGLVVGPTRPNGKNEDFDLEMFTLGLQQVEIAVDPSLAGNKPVLTVAPAVTGTAQVNSVLTSNTATFTGDATIVRTYQWFVGGSIVAGATNATYIPVVADIGKVVTVRVTGTNLAGSAFGFSAPTAAVIA